MPRIPTGRHERVAVEDVPFPERGVPGGYRDVWDTAAGDEVEAARQHQAALQADIAREIQAQRDERDIRRRRRQSHRARSAR